MELKLLNHQIKFERGYKDKDILAHEGGSGKTVCACVWLRDGRDSDALVVCPKRVVDKWRQALVDWGAKATVVSKEQFKKLSPKKWSALIIDEADEFASPLFTKNRSQLTETLYNLVRQYDSPILLLTGTPVRSNPWNFHTLLTFKGMYIDYKKWREEFFNLERMPYLPRPAWIPKKDWRTRIQKFIKVHCDIVSLKDCIGELPSSTEEIVRLKSEPFVSQEFEPKAQFVELHKHEQENKVKKILEISKEYRKVLVVAYYVEQIEELNKQLSKDRQTFMVHGSVKNQEAILKEANEVDECFLIVQASLGAGFDADTFSCVIFASMSYAVRDHVQMKWRVRRIHNLQPVIYYYLIAGKADRSILKNVQLGKDFVPSQWKNNEDN